MSTSANTTCSALYQTPVCVCKERQSNFKGKIDDARRDPSIYISDNIKRNMDLQGKCKHVIYTHTHLSMHLKSTNETDWNEVTIACEID